MFIYYNCLEGYYKQSSNTTINYYTYTILILFYDNKI